MFQFFINKALSASNNVDCQNFVGKSVSCPGAINYALTTHVDVRGSTLAVGNFFVFFSIFFFQPHFQFLTDLKYNRRRGSELGVGWGWGPLVGFGRLCSKKKHIMLLSVLIFFRNYAKIMLVSSNYALCHRNYAT